MADTENELPAIPGLDMVVAVTAGNYDTPDQWMPSLRVLREAVLASVL